MTNKTTNKKWTVMVYLAGDNDLDLNGMIDLKEMKKVGSTSEVNIIAQFDRAGAGLPTKRYCIQKGTSVDADVVESLPEINTGKPEFLLDFFEWCVRKYPADHYMLVLWNHGQGWDDTDIFARMRGTDRRLLRSSRIKHAFFRTSVEQAANSSADDDKLLRAILIDEDAKDFLDNVEMKNVLKDAKKIIKRKIDILGMDACLMSMAEVGYQMRDSVDYTVGSEETEPLDGWPYNTILDELVKKPTLSPDDLSKIIVKKYIASYKGSGDAVTQSACDLSTSILLKKAVKNLAKVLKAGLSNNQIRSSIVDVRNRVQEYDVNDNIDLVNFCKLLKSKAVPKVIKDACDLVIKVVKGTSGIVISSGYYGAEMKNSNGLAIYFPIRDLSPLYARLDFTKETGWDTFLKSYISSTRSQ